MKANINFNLTSNAIENLKYQTNGIYIKHEMNVLKFIEPSKAVNIITFNHHEISITRIADVESNLFLKPHFTTFYTVKTKEGTLKIEVVTKELIVEEQLIYAKYIIKDVGEVMLKIKYEISE